MIPRTTAEKVCDLSLKLMAPWKHLWKSHQAYQSPILYAVATILLLPTMALGLILFLTAIWWLPEPD